MATTSAISEEKEGADAVPDRTSNISATESSIPCYPQHHNLAEDVNQESTDSNILPEHNADADSAGPEIIEEGLLEAATPQREDTTWSDAKLIPKDNDDDGGDDDDPENYTSKNNQNAYDSKKPEIQTSKPPVVTSVAAYQKAREELALETESDSKGLRKDDPKNKTEIQIQPEKPKSILSIGRSSSNSAHSVSESSISSIRQDSVSNNEDITKTGGGSGGGARNLNTSLSRIHSVKSRIRSQKVVGAKKRLKVRFYPYTDVKEIRNLDDYKTKDKRTIWYTLEELDNMRPDMKYVKKLYRNCGRGDCMRGLEFRTKKGSRARMANYVNAGLSVIDEQEFQLTEGIHDPETLGKIYSNHTKRCSQNAQTMGLLDELYANKFVHDLPISREHLEAQSGSRWDGLRCCTCYVNEMNKPVGMGGGDLSRESGGGEGVEELAAVRERVMAGSGVGLDEDEGLAPSRKKGIAGILQKLGCPIRV